MSEPTTDIQADPVIDAFGGLTKTARALGHRNVTTVQGWRAAGKIPHWRRAEIEAAASKIDKEVPIIPVSSVAA